MRRERQSYRQPPPRRIRLRCRIIRIIVVVLFRLRREILLALLIGRRDRGADRDTVSVRSDRHRVRLINKVGAAEDLIGRDKTLREECEQRIPGRGNR